MIMLDVKEAKPHAIVARCEGMSPADLARYEAHRTRKGGDVGHISPERTRPQSPLDRRRRLGQHGPRQDSRYRDSRTSQTNSKNLIAVAAGRKSASASSRARKTLGARAATGHCGKSF